MLQQNFYPSRVIQVVPSDTIDIPNPSALSISSTATGLSIGQLVDAGQDFNSTSNPVAVGDIVFNTTDTTIATITSIVSATTLNISANIMALGENYSIYRKDSNQGCLVYVTGVDRNNQTVAGISSGGDAFNFSLAPVYAPTPNSAGNIVLPFQVKRIDSTGTLISAIGSIYALFN
jgi:hypothetical protein